MRLAGIGWQRPVPAIFIMRLPVIITRRIKITAVVAGSILLIAAATQVDWITQIKNKPVVDVRSYGADPAGVKDSTTAIQNALNAAAGHTAICVGTFLVSGALTPPANTTLMSGPGGSCTIYEATLGKDGIVPSNSGFTLDGVSLTGPWNSSLTSYHDCGSTGGCAINGAIGGNNITIKNTIISGWGGHCINSGGGYPYFVRNNSVSNCRQDGVLLISSGGGSYITGNTFTSTGSNSVDLNSSGNFILSNTIISPGYLQTGTDFYGILLAAGINGTLGQLDVSNNEIASNKVYSARGPAIDIRAQSGNTSQNDIHDNYLSISSDTPAVAWGIQIDSSVGAGCSGTVANNQISHNTVVNAYIGIGQGGGSFCTITNTQVTGNVVVGSTTYGIIASYGTGRAMLNIIQGSGTADLSWPNSVGAAICNNTTSGGACPINDSGEWWYDPATGRFGINVTTTPTANLQVSSAGNTEIDITSTGTGRVNRAQLLDQFGNYYAAYDLIHTIPEITVGQGNNHETTFNGAMHFGASGSTWMDFTGNCSSGTNTCPTYTQLTAYPYSSSPNGTLTYCRDCNSTCTGGTSSGTFCFRQAGSWAGFTSGSGTQTIFSGTQALSTSLIASTACTLTTVAATGALTSDRLVAQAASDPTGITGYLPSTSGNLEIWTWLTSNQINIKQCNPTGSSITPGALSLVLGVYR